MIFFREITRFRGDEMYFCILFSIQFLAFGILYSIDIQFLNTFSIWSNFTFRDNTILESAPCTKEAPSPEVPSLLQDLQP